MNYIFKTTATMKEYNNKKWYIDGGIVSDMRIDADSVENAGGNKYVVNCPCIHVSGSIAGMRRDFWGYKCDIVRVGQWIYKAN